MAVGPGTGMNNPLGLWNLQSKTLQFVKGMECLCAPLNLHLEKASSRLGGLTRGWGPAGGGLTQFRWILSQ